MSDNQGPLTVLMPVRNGARTVETAIRDIIAGLGTSDEFLIVDDGSSDATAEIAALASRRDARIRVLRTGGIGLVDALNLGVAEASWPWIARADADDRYPGERLPLQRQARTSGVVAITGDYLLVGPARTTRIPVALTPPFVALSLINPYRFPHPGVLFHKEAVLEVGGYQHDDFPAEDLALWMRLSEVGDLIGVPEVVVAWQMHSSSITHANQSLQRKLTRKLTDEYQLPRFDSSVVEAVEMELAAYARADLGSERTVLLGRDLWKARSHGVSMRHLYPLLLKESPNSMSILRAVCSLASDARLRRRFRRSLSSYRKGE